MARACAICGKTSMGGFNPQSTGMNRVRAHRRMAAQPAEDAPASGGVERHVLVCTRCRRTLQQDRLAGASQARRALSSQMVIGPSLTSSTSISAPKTPRATRTPRASTASQKRS